MKKLCKFDVLVDSFLVAWAFCNLPKRKRLLAWILGAPKLLREVLVLSISRAVHCDKLPLLWEDAITSSEDCFRESHGGRSRSDTRCCGSFAEGGGRKTHIENMTSRMGFSSPTLIRLCAENEAESTSGKFA